MEKIDVCFIILHYMDQNLTERTVASISGLNDIHNSKIVIVDNASPNESGKKLKQLYEKNNSIEVIRSDINGGFATGNNLGYQLCKSKYDMDFVIVVNNDVVFEQKDFIRVLYQCYNIESFFVAGPDIFVPHRSCHQSPILTQLRTVKDMEKSIQDGENWIYKYSKKFSATMYRKWLVEKFRDCKFMVKLIQIYRKIRPQRNIEWKKMKEGAVLFGACIIFSNQYCKINDILFEPLTFMYGEEDYLALRCKKNNWRMIYFPQLQVLHTNQGSTIANRISYREFCRKKRNSINECNKTYKIYIEMYKKMMGSNMDVQ